MSDVPTSVTTSTAHGGLTLTSPLSLLIYFTDGMTWIFVLLILQIHVHHGMQQKQWFDRQILRQEKIFQYIMEIKYIHIKLQGELTNLNFFV